MPKLKHPEKNCVCDRCMGACDENNPTCGECFLCEYLEAWEPIWAVQAQQAAKADREWEANLLDQREVMQPDPECTEGCMTYSTFCVYNHV